MPYKPSQQLIDILFNAGFRIFSKSNRVSDIYEVSGKPLIYQSQLFYSFKLSRTRVSFNNSMITVSYCDDPIYTTEALSTDQLRSVIFHTRLSDNERQKFKRCKLDPFNMPAVIEKVDYLFNTMHSGNLFGFHELIARYKAINIPEPDNTQLS